MLFDATRSRFLLVNPADCPEIADRSGPASVGDVLTRALELLGVDVDAAGQPASTPHQRMTTRTIAVSDPISLWRDGAYATQLAEAGVRSVTIAGAYLDEEVTVLALQASQLGFDVRVLIDVSPLRDRRNTDLVRARLTANGIVCATMRQTLLEAAVSSNDLQLFERIRADLRGVYITEYENGDPRFK